MTTEPIVYRDGSHTAILVSLGDKFAHFIPMDASGINIVKMPVMEFHHQWSPYLDYPVRRAAELYLGIGSKTKAAIPISPQARDHLEKIVANRATEYQPAQQPETQGKSTMAKKTPNGLDSLTGALTKTFTPEKSAAKAPAKAAAKAAPAAPAKAPAKAAAKAAPAKAPAKAAAKAAPAKAPAKAAVPAKKGAAPKVAGDVKHKVADDSGVKRGFLREYVDEAKKMKVFTRDALVAKFTNSQEEERLVRYFYYCTGNGIFAAA